MCKNKQVQNCRVCYEIVVIKTIMTICCVHIVMFKTVWTHVVA